MYAGGEEIDFYLSRTDFEDVTEDVAGDAVAWCDTLNVPWLQQDVRALFAARDFAFENERHAALAQAFGWPAAVVGVSYDELELGFRPDDISEEHLVHVLRS